MTEPTTDDRLLASIRAIIRAEFPRMPFLGLYDYVVAATDGTTVDCTPVDASTGLPALTRISLRPSTAGETITPTIGTGCIVAFLDGNPAKPVLVSASPTATTLTLDASTLVSIGPSAAQVQIAGGGPFAARVGDPILAGGIFAGTITLGSFKTQIG